MSVLYKALENARDARGTGRGQDIDSLAAEDYERYARASRQAGVLRVIMETPALRSGLLILVVALGAGIYLYENLRRPGDPPFHVYALNTFGLGDLLEKSAAPTPGPAPESVSDRALSVTRVNRPAPPIRIQPPSAQNDRSNTGADMDADMGQTTSERASAQVSQASLLESGAGLTVPLTPQDQDEPSRRQEDNVERNLSVGAFEPRLMSALPSPARSGANAGIRVVHGETQAAALQAVRVQHASSSSTSSPTFSPAKARTVSGAGTPQPVQQGQQGQGLDRGFGHNADNSHEIKTLIRLAAQRAQENDLHAARSLYRRVVELAPDNVLFHYNLAVLHDRANDLEQAVAAYRRVLENAHRVEQTAPFDRQAVIARLDYLEHRLSRPDTAP